jgi:hypothetical protein
MYKKSLFIPVAILIITTFFVSCDKDFNEIGTNIIGDGHYGFLKDSLLSVDAHSFYTGGVQSNNQAVNPLGIYKDPVFGKTTASLVTQVQFPTGSENPTIGDDPVIKSVVLNIPYFSTLTATNSDGSHTYSLDSVYNPSKHIKLQVFQSDYFLRDQGYSNDPTPVLGTQLYYTDDDLTATTGNQLNNDPDPTQNDAFTFSAAELVDTTTATDGTVTTTRSKPGMRLKLDATVFDAAFLHAPAGSLLNNNVLKNYFRGLYFKVSDSGSDNGDGTMGMLNFQGGTITISYDELTPSTTDDAATRVDETMTLNLTGNSVSLLQKENQPTTVPANRIYLQGGQGFAATIKLFGADSNGNGIADELETIKNENWMINEASLTFNVDLPTTGITSSQRLGPRRIYLFDATHNQPILDYYDDNTTTIDVKNNKYVFGGIIQKDTVTITGQVTRLRYKIRVTDYLRSLIHDDSTNVTLGLNVTESIATITKAKRKQTAASTDEQYITTASVMNPLGTVLYGSDIPAGDPDYDKRLKLVVYYTKPE